MVRPGRGLVVELVLDVPMAIRHVHANESTAVAAALAAEAASGPEPAAILDPAEAPPPPEIGL